MQLWPAKRTWHDVFVVEDLIGQVLRTLARHWPVCGNGTKQHQAMQTEMGQRLLAYNSTHWAHPYPNMGTKPLQIRV
jgi:hypothetical protein